MNLYLFSSHLHPGPQPSDWSPALWHHYRTWHHTASTSAQQPAQSNTMSSFFLQTHSRTTLRRKRMNHQQGYLVNTFLRKSKLVSHGHSLLPCHTYSTIIVLVSWTTPSYFRSAGCIASPAHGERGSGNSGRSAMSPWNVIIVNVMCKIYRIAMSLAVTLRVPPSVYVHAHARLIRS